MLVKCIKLFPDDSIRVGQEQFLKIGKEYVVLVVYADKKGTFYQIESENDEQLVIVEACLFEIISTYIPSNWQINCKVLPHGTTHLVIAPKSWETASIDFYEEITELQHPFSYWREVSENKRPEVIKLYFQERDLIYKEEEENRLKLDSK